MVEFFYSSFKDLKTFGFNTKTSGLNIYTVIWIYSVVLVHMWTYIR